MAATYPAATTLRARLTPVSSIMMARAPATLVASRVTGTAPAAPEREEQKAPTSGWAPPPEPKSETPWLLYGAGAAVLIGVGYVVYTKKFARGR